MQLRWISATGVSEHPVEAVAELLTRPDGLVWLDIPTWDEAAERVLREVFEYAHGPLTSRQVRGPGRPSSRAMTESTDPAPSSARIRRASSVARCR